MSHLTKTQIAFNRINKPIRSISIIANHNGTGGMLKTQEMAKNINTREYMEIM